MQGKVGQVKKKFGFTHTTYSPDVCYGLVTGVSVGQSHILDLHSKRLRLL